MDGCFSLEASLDAYLWREKGSGSSVLVDMYCTVGRRRLSEWQVRLGGTGTHDCAFLDRGGGSCR